MAAKLDRPHREPNHIQAWLIGSGIASLSAAVHLINDAKVPGANINVLDVHSGPGGEMNPSGDAQNGYFIPFGCHPHFHGSCMERLLSLVPSQAQPGRSMMDAIRTFEKFERPSPQDFALTRTLKQRSLGPEVVYTKGIHIGVRNMMFLMKIMLESEKTIGSKTIEDMLDASFFKTTFWMLWATA
jgi:oleate hydratase